MGGNGSSDGGRPVRSPTLVAGMDALDGVADWPVDAAAVGVVRWDPTAAPEPATRARRWSPATPDRAFPWASVTKPATALAVLVAVEEGTLGLDEPGRAPGIDGAPPPGPRLGPRARARAAGRATGRPADLLERRLRTAGRAAGVRRRACRSPTTCPRGSWSRWAWPGPTRRPVRPGRAPPPGSPARWPTCWPSAGEWARPDPGQPDHLAPGHAVQFPGLAGVLPGFGPFDPCDWGLGVEVRGGKHPHWTGPPNSPATYGHFGQSGSFLWVDPVAGVLCCGLADRPFRRLGVTGVARPGRRRPGRTRPRRVADGRHRTGRLRAPPGPHRVAPGDRARLGFAA